MFIDERLGMKRSRVSPPEPAALPNAAEDDDEDEEHTDVEHEDDAPAELAAAAAAASFCCCICICLRCHRGITEVLSGASKDMAASKLAMSAAEVVPRLWMLLVFIMSVTEGFSL